jgi:hypothetical protein
MMELRALTREREGGRRVYRVNETAPVWKAIRILVSSTADPSRLVEDALADVEGLEAAFIFGSVARGEQDETSDIDVLVVESEDVNRRKLLERPRSSTRSLSCSLAWWVSRNNYGRDPFVPIQHRRAPGRNPWAERTDPQGPELPDPCPTTSSNGRS